MKTINTSVIAAFFLISMAAVHVQAQSKLSGLLKKVTSAAENKKSTTTDGKTTGNTTISSKGSPSVLEIGQGIKEALETGISHGADLLSAKDGFMGNMAVKILFPPEAQAVEKTLRSIGLGSLADNVILSLNRAAEDAAKEAKPIFIAAIKQMTLTDASNILLGSQDAATNYFKKTTTAQLTEKFKPVIARSLTKVGATKYWGDAANQYNKVPFVKPVSTDLSDYATQKAIDGMFIQVAQEELKIRDDIGARPSPLLQKVFGYADQNK